MWVDVARVVRGQAIALRTSNGSRPAGCLGLSTPRIVLGHILPNLAGPIAVLASANFAAAILIEAGLSFMGVGAQIPMPSWGNLIRDHYGAILTGHAHLALIPGRLHRLLGARLQCPLQFARAGFIPTPPRVI